MIQGGLQRELLPLEDLLTVQLKLVKCDLVLRLFDLRLNLPVIRFESVQIVANHAELGLGQPVSCYNSKSVLIIGTLQG